MLLCLVICINIFSADGIILLPIRTELRDGGGGGQNLSKDPSGIYKRIKRGGEILEMMIRARLNNFHISESLIATILNLRAMLQELEEKVRSMQEYIDGRLASILDTNPGALGISN